jgi:hypothetical protein
MGFYRSGSHTDKHLPQSPITGKLFLNDDILLAFYEFYLSTVVPLTYHY